MRENQNETGLPGVYFRGVHNFFIVACVVGGGMFCFKLFSFMRTIKKDELAGFAFDPIMIYGWVSIGFLFLLVWAYSTGQFKDIERAKFEMLEKYDAQVRAEALQAAREASDVA